MAETIKTKTGSDATQPSTSKDQTQLDRSQADLWNFVQQSIATESQKNLEKLQAESKKLIEASQKKLKEQFDKKLESSLDAAKEKFKQETDNSRIGIIETLAIFVALFTFVSVNITIFTKIEYLAGAIWFMILMSLTLVIFLSILLIFLHRQQSQLLLWLIPFAGFAIMIALLLLGQNFEDFNPRINPEPKEIKVDMTKIASDLAKNKSVATPSTNKD